MGGNKMDNERCDAIRIRVDTFLRILISSATILGKNKDEYDMFTKLSEPCKEGYDVYKSKMEYGEDKFSFIYDFLKGKLNEIEYSEKDLANDPMKY